ncbi:RNA polymerase sigma factor [Streptomyces antnestii]|uniref:RNA polymerase sigma factor n=1 Tax=Streptomyces antnestii TaxID=2494256 RepID=A0A3S3UKH4_9ACTN|nr:RNA polymerase sigma factor [Streptomyces sp. San01]RVU29013.1 RNA polymerase sigma factor [Streptomyces sp. San01]
MSDADASDQENPVAQSAHDAAFDEFFRQNKDYLLRYLVVRTRTVFDADEILMDAAIRVYERWPYIEASRNRLGLVRKIVHGFWVDHYRRQARRAGREILADDIQTLVSDGGTIDELLKLRGYEELHRAMATLERTAPTQARCVRLHYFEGLASAEIAEQTGSTAAAVRTNLSKGRVHLRRLLRPTRNEGER